MAIVTDIYAELKGRKFGSWVRSPFTTSDLIEGPSFIAESIYRDALGLATAKINTASFDLAGNAGGKRENATWKYARSLNESGNSLTYLSELASDGAVVLMRDYQDKEKVVPLDFNQPDDSTALTTADILEENGQPLIRARQTHVGLIRNEFYLNYNPSYATGQFLSQFYITASATNMVTNTRDNTDGNGATYTALCTNSQSYYNKTERWTYNAPWIRSDTTAELFLKVMANWLTIRKWQINATLLYNGLTLKYELMDTCFWNVTLLPSAIRTNVGFLITKLTDGGLAKPNTIDIETLQVPIFFGQLGYGSGFGFAYGTQL